MDPLPEWYASDNGFPSRAEMDTAHQPIVALATAALSGTGGNVLDLGCGNGALLKKIHEANPGSVPFGIDIAPTRIEDAAALNPPFAAHFVSGDLFESDLPWPGGRRYALVILMPGRLLEAGPHRAVKLRKRLHEACAQLLVYAYDDWLAQHGTLANLAAKAGISLRCRDADAVASLAERW
jgi:SAM-dependent methyltransferase